MSGKDIFNEYYKNPNKYVLMDLWHMYLKIVNIYCIFAAVLLSLAMVMARSWLLYIPFYFQNTDAVKYFEGGKKRVTAQHIKL